MTTAFPLATQRLRWRLAAILAMLHVFAILTLVIVALLLLLTLIVLLEVPRRKPRQSMKARQEFDGIDAAGS